MNQLLITYLGANILVGLVLAVYHRMRYKTVWSRGELLTLFFFPAVGLGLWNYWKATYEKGIQSNKLRFAKIFIGFSLVNLISVILYIPILFGALNFVKDLHWEHSNYQGNNATGEVLATGVELGTAAVVGLAQTVSFFFGVIIIGLLLLFAVGIPLVIGLIQQGIAYRELAEDKR